MTVVIQEVGIVAVKSMGKGGKAISARRRAQLKNPPAPYFIA